MYNMYNMGEIFCSILYMNIWRIVQYAINVLYNIVQNI